MSEPIEVGPLTDEERESIALFPLPTVVLYPGTAVALHLFEERYRELGRDVLASGEHGVAPRVIAICALQPGWEGSYDGRPALRPLACAGRIVDARLNGDGTIDLVLVGVERVSLEELAGDGRLYRRARGARVEELVSSGVAAAAGELSVILRGLGVEVPDTPEGASSAFADRVADVALRDPHVRQEILETLDVEKRLRRVADEVSRRVLGTRKKGALH
jgi:hypothetical protein